MCALIKLNQVSLGDASLTVSPDSPQVPHNINFREKKSKLKKDKKAESSATEENSGVKGRIARFRYFEDISGYSGVRMPLLRTNYRPLLFKKQPCNQESFCVFAIPGIYLRPVSSLDVGHVSWSIEASPNDH